MRDPYDILGVSKAASEAEIKKAFRALAKKHHPDTHAGDKGAQKRFQEISGAYDILGDKEKRMILSAIIGLANIGKDAESAIPALQDLTTNKDQEISRTAADAINYIKEQMRKK